MLSKLYRIPFEFPFEFWKRLFIVAGAYFLAQLAILIVNLPVMVDNSLLFSIYFCGALAAMVIVPKIVTNPISNYIIVQAMFFWFALNKVMSNSLHFSFKPHALVFGFTFCIGSFYLLKYFSYLWKFIAFRCYFIFFLINIIYYFYHYSLFNISDYSTFGVKWASEGFNAKTIAFIDSIAFLMCTVVSLCATQFLRSKFDIDKLIYQISKVFCYCFIGFTLIFPFIINNKISGDQIYLPIYLLLMLGFKYYIDNNKNLSFISDRFKNLMSLSILFVFGIAIFGSNKSSIIGILASVFLFTLTNKRLGFNLNFLNGINKNFKLISLIIASIVSVGAIILFNVPEIMYMSIKNVYIALTGHKITSFYIRLSNWDLFLNYWKWNLDIFHSIFGFGLGKSREVMYLLTQSQYAKRFYMQTTHNQTFELFFDYGLMATLFYIPIITIIYNNIKILFCSFASKNLQLISNLSNCLLVFYLIYHLTDNMRVPTAIIFFSALMMVEGIKYKLKAIDENEK